MNILLHDESHWIVTVRSTLSVLTFCCVLFNQHAEQSPSDPTPPAEAERFEQSINEQRAKLEAAAQKVLPPCPGCGERRWKIDADVITRSATMVIGDDVEVLVDRVDGEQHFYEPDNITLEQITCQGCAAMPATTLDGTLIVERAQKAMPESDTPWRIIDDYRQF